MQKNYQDFLPFAEEQLANASAALQGVDPITQIIIVCFLGLLTVGLFIFTFSMVKLLFKFMFKMVKSIFSILFARPKKSENSVPPTQKSIVQKQEVVSAAKNDYFCSNCGIKFSERVLDAIKINHKAHCEGCGQGFMLGQI